MDRWVHVLRETAREWSRHHINRLGASLSFYAIFSLAPLLVVVLELAGGLFGEQAVRGQIHTEVEALMGPRLADSVRVLVESLAVEQRPNTLATWIGLAALFLASTGLFAELRRALNLIWGVPERAARGGLPGWLWSRFLAFAMVMVVLLLVLASLAFTSGFAFASTFATDRFSVPPQVWGWFGTGVAFVGEVVLFACIFKILPDLRLRWGRVWTGAIVTALLFEAGKFAMGWYFVHSPVGTTYRAAGSILLVLLWVYYTALIVLTGAEFTQVNARLRHRPERKRPAAAPDQPARVRPSR
jgi:membrane protein